MTHAIIDPSKIEPVYENRTVEFTCTSYSLPSAQIQWYRSYRISTAQIIVDVERETHTREDNVIRVKETLTYRVNRSVNGWSVYCTANDGQSNVATSDKIELSVLCKSS